MSRFSLPALTCLLSLSLAQLSHADSFDSNRNQVRANVSAGGWHVIWGVNINEAEYLKAASSIYAGSPHAYFSDYLTRTKAKVLQNAPDVGQRALDAAIVRALTGKQVVTVSGVGVKGGIATYRRWKEVSAHVPDGTEKYKINGPFGTWTWGWRPKMKLVKKTIPLPNHHQPYIAFRIAKTGPTPPAIPRPPVPHSTQKPNASQKIFLYNQTRNPITYSVLRATGGWQQFTVQPGQNTWHSSSTPQFSVKFDARFQPGWQGKEYRITPGSHNDFKLVSNSSLDLYRR